MAKKCPNCNSSKIERHSHLLEWSSARQDWSNTLTRPGTIPKSHTKYCRNCGTWFK